jgi:hypothetical protein
MSAVSGDRATGHQRIDHKFAFKLFEYDEPDNFQRKEMRARNIENDFTNIDHCSSMHQDAILL